MKTASNQNLMTEQLSRLHALIPHLTRAFKGLADENRLRILLVLADSRKSVGQIVEAVELSQPLVSHHLKGLKIGGLVQLRREGPFIFYEPAGPQVIDVLKSLADLIAEQRAADNAY